MNHQIEESDNFNDYIKKHPNFTGCVIDADGNKAYCKNGLYHRENGPAVEYANGINIYYKNGEYHREDGPAFEFANGYKEYWLNDKEYYYEDWKKKVMNIKLSRILKKIDDENS